MLREHLSVCEQTGLLLELSPRGEGAKKQGVLTQPSRRRIQVIVCFLRATPPRGESLQERPCVEDASHAHDSRATKFHAFPQIPNPKLSPHYPGKRKDPFYIYIRNPIRQKVETISKIDEVNPLGIWMQ